MEPLPHIDDHTVATHASNAIVWASLLRVLRNTMGGSATFARLLGCEPAALSAEFAGEVGETLPGFRVVDASPGHRLALEGRHRFSHYRLTFELDGEHVRASTDAVFPGVLGRMYRAVVIGTGGHKLITRRMLRQIARV